MSIGVGGRGGMMDNRNKGRGRGRRREGGG